MKLGLLTAPFEGSDLIDVDPFETAATWEAVRQQLETLNSVTARTQNLSLVNFL